MATRPYRVSEMPSDSEILATGTSRICGGSRFPASMTSMMVRRPGMEYRLSANAAIEARISDRTTAGTVTSAELTIARLRLPSSPAVRKFDSVKDCGNAESPFCAMSSKDRTAMSSTNTIGATHSRVNGVMTRWNAKPRKRPCRPRGALAAGAGGVPVGISGTDGAGVVVDTSVDLLPERAHQVRDDEPDGQRKDDDRQSGRLAEVQERERLLEHVGAEQL